MIDVERIVADALRLCAIPAPTGDEGARAAALSDLLAGAGLTPQRDGAGNVVAHIQGRRAGPAVVVTAHLDTVFPAGTRLHPARDGDVLRGPGIGDNAIALATLVALARELSGRDLERDVLLAGTVGEEGIGNLRGVRALLRDWPAQCVVALEGHWLDHIVTRAVGSVRLEVAVATPGGHSWQDRGAPSAIQALAGAATETVQRIREAAPGCAVNVGVFHGGTSVNTIAAGAELQLDLRATDMATLAAGEAIARDIFARAQGAGVSVTVRELGRRPAGALADDHPLVVTAQQARAGAGLPPAGLVDGSTDANAAYEHGIPGISIGITTGSGVHRPDEQIAVAPIRAGAMAALLLLTRLSRR